MPNSVTELHCQRRFHHGLALAALLGLSQFALGGVLPEDRGDLMYHSYDGGNVTVNGPSLLVRKNIGEKVSVSANYYVDMVTSASIDVEVLGASEYKEERTQGSLGIDYLRGKTTYNASYIESIESDYQAKTVSLGIGEDMFGDLTTVSLGYTRAWDKVFKNIKQPDGELVNEGTYGGQRAYRSADHRSYRIGLSQILTKTLILGLNYESQTHEGQLSNPYRAIRYLSLTGLEQFSEEKYPNTRTTNAVALDGRYFLPYRAAIHGSYRFFSDTWGIVANTFEIGYTHPWRNWTFDGSFRSHKQEAASFYSDLFPRPNYQNFQARDRNISTMNNRTIHVGVEYDLAQLQSWSWSHSWIQKGTINLALDHIAFVFEDFRDARMSKSEFTDTPTAVGAEPLYTEDANIIRFFLSVWF